MPSYAPWKLHIHHNTFVLDSAKDILFEPNRLSTARLV